MKQFPPKGHHTDATAMTQMAIRLSELAEALALEDRTLVRHKPGRIENVAEHSLMLAIMAPAIAEVYYPDLDPGLVARFAAIHDAVEAYVGDTPTYEISDDDLKLKVALEEKGLEQLRQDYAAYSQFIDLVQAYEDQRVAEARFVRVIDKWAPLLIHLMEGGSTLRSHFTAEELQDNSDRRAAALLQEYPEYSDLIDTRQELATLAIKHLYPAR